jgi:hypothetical protein
MTWLGVNASNRGLTIVGSSMPPPRPTPHPPSPRRLPLPNGRPRKGGRGHSTSETGAAAESCKSLPPTGNATAIKSLAHAAPRELVGGSRVAPDPRRYTEASKM